MYLLTVPTFLFDLYCIQRVFLMYADYIPSSCNASYLWSWKWSFRISPGVPTTIRKVFRGVYKSLYANGRLVPSIRPRPIPFTSFHYSLFTMVKSLAAIVGLADSVINKGKGTTVRWTSVRSSGQGKQIRSRYRPHYVLISQRSCIAKFFICYMPLTFLVYPPYHGRLWAAKKNITQN